MCPMVPRDACMGYRDTQDIILGYMEYRGSYSRYTCRAGVHEIQGYSGY